MAFPPGTSPFSSPRQGLQAQWLWRPGSPSKQRLPATQPSYDYKSPPSPLEGCLQCGKNGDPALYTSNGSPPTPSPPSTSSRPPSNVSTSFPTLVTMGGIAPVDACPPPAVLTEWRCYACHDSLGGSNMVNLRSGEQLWQPPASDWDVLEWDIEYPKSQGYLVTCPWIPPMGSLRLYHQLDPSPNEVHLVLG